MPWEDSDAEYPSNMASPLEIIVEASNGASDYGNKFGEPVISGFARSFGMSQANGNRREWIKPIMFSGGLGTVDANLTKKLEAKKGRDEIESPLFFEWNFMKFMGFLKEICEYKKISRL